MASGIYKITNTTNGKVYVGSAVNFDTRWKEHVRELRKGKHHSSALQNAWNKYGEDNFEFSIIEECERIRKVLLGREQYWMDTLDSVANGYNIAKTAGSQLGMKQSPEAIAARVEKNTGKKRTPETKALMSEVQSNRSPEWCANISASKKRYWAEKGTDSIKGENNPMYGKSPSQETLEKMSRSLTGKKRTPEQRAKMRETQSKRPQEVNDKIAASLRGGKRTPEQIVRFSEVQSNRSPEWRNNISSSKKETWASKGDDERTLIFIKSSLAQGKRKSSSGFTGVYERSGKWKVRLTVNKEKISLGNFPTPEAANAARVKYLTDLKAELESKLANPPC